MNEHELLALVAGILLAGKFNDTVEDAIHDAQFLIKQARETAYDYGGKSDTPDEALMRRMGEQR